MAWILLPTHAWTPACDDVISQLTATDELVLLVDAAEDIAGDVPDRDDVTVLVVGDPSGCSGKANAIASGLAYVAASDDPPAEDDLILFTDADYRRDDDWLETLRAGVRKHGAATGVPVFRSHGLAGAVVEPLTTPLTLSTFGFGTAMWGGAMGVSHELIDVDATCADLRRTVSDDVMVAEHAEVDPASLRSLTEHVPVEGTASSLLDRTIRFARTLRFTTTARVWPVFVIAAVVTGGLALAPLLSVAVLYLCVTASYYAAGFHDRGIPRWTAILAPLSVYVVTVLTTYGLLTSVFSWGGRRYRWHSKFDVDVLGTAGDDAGES
jgi:hypothetical protein